MSRLVCAFIVTFGVSVPLYAQVPRADGPFAGIFGGQATEGQTLELRASSVISYQDALRSQSDLGLLPEVPQVDARQQSSGYGGGSASIGYTFQRSSENSALSFGGNGSLSKYSLDHDSWPYSAGAYADISTNLTPKSRLSIRGNGLVSPYYSYGFVNGQMPLDSGLLAQGFTPVGLPTAALDLRTVDLAATAMYSADFSRRTSIQLTADWRDWRLLDETTGDVRRYGGTARMSHRFTRNMGVHAGFGRQVGQSYNTAEDDIVFDSIDAGVDYGGSFALGRRTQVRFGTSTGVLHDLNQTNFRINGDAGISREFGRTWTGTARYVRDSGFVPGMRRLTLSDTASGDIGGQLGVRTSLQSRVWWTRGASSSGGPSYTSQSATSTMQFAVMKPVAFYVQYAYYHYNVPPSATYVTQSGRLSRQTITAGLNVWTSLLGPERGRR